MARKIEIVEVGLRDGLQSESIVLPTEQKIALIERLIAAGVRRLEAASFVNPKKVPQMADAEAVLAGVPRRADVTYTGLVLNRRGVERAVAAGCDEIGMVIVASDTFNRRNQGVPTQESVDNWLEIAAAARRSGVRAQVTIAAAFGCPFEGEVPLTRVLDIAQRAAEGEPCEIAFADSIGVAVPAQVSELFGRMRELLPGIALRAHFHNTRNTGIANAWAALQAGAAALDASIGGIGGCPFAPAATGNIATEDLQYLLERSGVETGLSLRALLQTSEWLQESLGKTLPAMLLKSGGFPRSSL
ncbi:MAG TPA: hydroxymethylglutaryl-CoA lyase [Steroidobacter sp.]|uniref:hydroxymethylglutaryl-CoA lyase n=1 Tax=Steroidobacter sp. TaxID=1978227 RepID=UPI002ED9BE23